jgi:hypothetical protein
MQVLFPIILIFLLILSHKIISLKSRSLINFTHISYFLLTGFNYMLLEIYFMQIFGLFLGNPIYSLTLVLVILLISTGLGSFLCKKLQKSRDYLSLSIIILIGLLFFFYKTYYYFIFSNAINSIFIIKFLLMFILISPIGIILGLFFPYGITLISNKAQDLPYLLTLNNIASVCGSLIGIFISQYLGFKSVLVFAMLLYILFFFIHRFADHN